MIIVKTLDNKITEQINEADLQKYIDLGYVAVSSDEVDMIEENGTTKWKYKSEDNTKYRTLSGGSGEGLPTGGTTGQVLAKASNADNDVEWVDETGGTTKPIYTFYEADRGAGTAYVKLDEAGGLLFGGIGYYGTEQKKGITTCDELIGVNKMFKFYLKDFAAYPSIFLFANGTGDVQGANFKALEINFNYSTITIKKWTGTTPTTIKTVYQSEKVLPIEVVVKQYGKRISFYTINGFTNKTTTQINIIEDADFELMGNIAGFSNGDGSVSYVSNIEIADLTSAGINLICGGDSQTAEGGIYGGMDVVNHLVKMIKYKNIDVRNTAVSGRVIQQVIDGFATEVAPYVSDIYDNIYYINIGTNDMDGIAIETMITNFDTLVSLAKNAGFKVFATTVAYPNGGMSEASQTKLKTFNDHIRGLKTSGDIDYILDFYDNANGFTNENNGINMNLITLDNLHFTGESRRKIAQKIYDVLSFNTEADILTGNDTGNGVGMEFSRECYKKLMQNYTSGTFTTNDGKTITIIDGMVTSIV